MDIKTKIKKKKRPVKLKNLFTAKNKQNKTKRQPTEWEKILSNDMSDKGLGLQNLQIAHMA